MGQLPVLWHLELFCLTGAILRTQTLGCCRHMGLARDSYLGVDQTGRAFGYDRNLTCPSSALLSDVEKISISWLPHSTVSKLGIASRRVGRPAPVMHPVVFWSQGCRDSSFRAKWDILVAHSVGVQVGSTRNFFIIHVYLILTFCKVNVTDTKIR